MDSTAQSLVSMFESIPMDSRLGSSGILPDHPLSRYMDIAISVPVFEVPLFYMPWFTKHLQDVCHADTENLHLVAPLLAFDNRYVRYKTIPSILAKQVFQSEFHKDGLLKIAVPNSDVVYYGTHGAVFDSGMHPIFIASWKIRRKDKPSLDNTFSQLVLQNPVIRISPQCYLERNDGVQSFIANKLLKTFLESKVPIPCFYTMPYLDKEDSFYRDVQVILENSPFNITSVPNPSVSTTQQELRDVVIDNIQDLESFICQ